MWDSGVCRGAGVSDPAGNRILLHRRYAPYPDGRRRDGRHARSTSSACPRPMRKRSLEFYVETLGLRPDERSRNEFWIGRDLLRRSGEPAQVRRRVRAAARTASRSSRSTTSPQHARSSRRRESSSTARRFDTGVCHMASFKDPDGNPLMLHRRYAPYTDGANPDERRARRLRRRPDAGQGAGDAVLRRDARAAAEHELVGASGPSSRRRNLTIAILPHEYTGRSEFTPSSGADRAARAGRRGRARRQLEEAGVEFAATRSTRACASSRRSPIPTATASCSTTATRRTRTARRPDAGRARRLRVVPDAGHRRARGGSTRRRSGSRSSPRASTTWSSAPDR